ncbi:MAG: hypothetical protein EHM20_17555 [Alphaproteobacteria bacterium]|nr:MAG: hypothetical protein EHM20_17555 [Alphaproteobacteria bacterium]
MKIIIFLSAFFLILSCGKSPLLLKKNNDTSVISGLEVHKIFKTTNQSLTLNWLSPVNSIDEGHALLIVKQQNIATDFTKDFSVILWMPTMGHGSSPIQIKKLGTGIYDLSQIYFIMDGLWHLRIQLKDGSNIIEEQIFEYYL